MSEGLVVESVGLNCLMELMSPESDTTVVMPRSCSRRVAMKLLLRRARRLYSTNLARLRHFGRRRLRCWAGYGRKIEQNKGDARRRLSHCEWVLYRLRSAARV